MAGESYDYRLAVSDDLAFVPTTQRGQATAAAPLTLAFAWPTHTANTRLKGFRIVVRGPHTAQDGVTAEVGVDLSPVGGPAWWKVQDLTQGALPIPADGVLDMEANYAMSVQNQPLPVQIRVRYETASALPVDVAVVALSWFAAGEVITPPPGL
jgi:hypothetical protein